MAGLVTTTLVLAVIFTLVPLPETAAWFRPDIVALVLMYWWLAHPEKIGIYTGFFMGLLLDVMQGSLLGVHGCGLVIIAWIFLKNYQRIRVLPLVQQALIVFFVLLIKYFIGFWVDNHRIQGFSGTLLYFAPCLTGAILWPWLFVTLRDLRRRAGT
ncbi:rod shape-determining protein MreD [gamma proteobacterium HTCC5015]|nr:rod shape-determining protein MreD [gamma proteobacterium HTCC5015]